MERNLDTGAGGSLPAHRAFYAHEAEKLRRIYTTAKWHIDNPQPATNAHRRNFAIFVDEHDRRRGTDFLGTFPELADFYDLCKRLN